MPRKKYSYINLEPNAKRRWERAKPPGVTYTEHLNTMLNKLLKDSTQEGTLDTHLEITCPVLIRIEETCYCALKPPRAAKLLTLQQCLAHQAMKKYDHVLELMREGYTETITFPICGGAERMSRGKHWIRCPREGLAEKIYPDWCKNSNCPKLKTKDVTINLEGLTATEPNL